jgi:hypothetical protein
MYPKYKKYQGVRTVQLIYDFLSQPESIYKMIQACTMGKPALNGVLEIESIYRDRTDFDISVGTHKQLVGSMVREILMDFGYVRNIQRIISGGNFFTSAMHYTFDISIAIKKVELRPIIVDLI